MIHVYKRLNLQCAIGLCFMLEGGTARAGLLLHAVRGFHRVSAREQILDVWRKRAWDRGHEYRNILADHRNGVTFRPSLSADEVQRIEHLEVVFSVLATDSVSQIKDIETLLLEMRGVYPKLDMEGVRQTIVSAGGEDANIIARIYVLQGGENPYRANI